jgi:hypothetical protein
MDAPIELVLVSFGVDLLHAPGGFAKPLLRGKTVKGE